MEQMLCPQCKHPLDPYGVGFKCPNCQFMIFPKTPKFEPQEIQMISRLSRSPMRLVSIN